MISRTAAVLVILATLCFEVSAADIRPFISGSGVLREIVIEGKIAPGDFETFKRIIRENNGRVSGVYCFSPGGNFYEAMKIGRAMRALELHSQAPMRDPSGQASCGGSGLSLDLKPNDPNNCTCASAGFFLHIGAVHRGGTYLAVHRPYFEKGEFGNLSEADAREAFNALQDSARNYMTEMGVPQHVQEEVLATPSDKGLLLDEKTIKTYFWLDLPYRHEWLKNKCPQLSSSEKQQLSIYSNRLRRSRNASTADLTKQEWADLDALQKKEDKERKCEIAIIQRGQIEAYEKYFNVKANDFANQNFSKWSEATKYLGKHFYDLMSEEKFDEDKDALSDVISSLRRDATATAPSVLLFDTQSKPRVVASINLLSTPNPSSEYIQRLVKSLEDAWGKPSGGNEASEWRWTAKEFFAVLKKETFAEGPIIDLKIEARRQ